MARNSGPSDHRQNQERSYSSERSAIPYERDFGAYNEALSVSASAERSVPRKRGRIRGNVVGESRPMGRLEIPGFFRRWAASFFAGRPFARRREGVSFYFSPEGSGGVHHVRLYGSCMRQDLRNGACVEVAGRPNADGTILARNVYRSDPGGAYRSIARRRIGAWLVRLLTIVLVLNIAWFGSTALNAVRNAENRVDRASQSAAESGSNLSRKLADGVSGGISGGAKAVSSLTDRLLSYLAGLYQAYGGYVLTMILVVYGCYIMITGRFR